MQETKSVHPIFNNRWSPVIDWIVWSIISGIIITIAKRLGYGRFIHRFEFFVFLGIAILMGIVTLIWRRLFFGTVVGTVFIEDRKLLPRQVQNIEIAFTTDNYMKIVRPVLTNINGKYSFDCKVPVGSRIIIKAFVGHDEVISENVGEIEDVRWLFGIPFFGLPISSGNSKQVDLVIPNSPQNTIETPRPVRSTFNLHHLPWILLGTAVIIFSLWGKSMEVWGSFFEGTIYGQVTREDGDTNRLHNIEISIAYSDFAKKIEPVLTNSIGKYRFDNCIPV
ncbi:hypothetical protein F4212_04000, partial [Candidatus Poribacteria bacterium]|nr:hypothetical protein [Candidatus Poribacteria bacterium]